MGWEDHPTYILRYAIFTCFSLSPLSVHLSLPQQLSSDGVVIKAS